MNLAKFDRLVENAKDRAEAAEVLAHIASRHPDLFAEFAAIWSSNGAAKTAVKPHQNSSMSTAALVLAYVKAHDPATAGEVIDAIVPEIASRSKSSDPRNVVYAALHGLVKRKKLELHKRGFGGKNLYKIAKKPTDQ